ncbi:MAG: hypothetical protein HY319_29410 [Armatimonadetes bacterium]|nr:hypothetical protein [Armatimonadota bacterium]
MSFLLNNAAQSGVLQGNIGASRSVHTKEAEKLEGSTGANYTPVGGEEADSRFHSTRPNPGNSGTNQAQRNAGQAGASQTGEANRRRVRRKRVLVPKKGGSTQTAKQQNAQPQTAETRGPRGQQSGQLGTGSFRGGSSQAKNTLMSGSFTTRASVQFEQAQQAQNKDNTNPLSPSGQRKDMLNKLERMVNYALAQHTGGSAGEAYPRRETRQILMALQGLKSSSQPKADKKEDGRRLTEGEFKLKEGSANSIMAIFADPPQPPPNYEPLELVA